MTSFDLEDDLEENVESTLGYGDKKKDVYNEAIHIWIKNHPILDEYFDRGNQEQRVMFVEETVREKVKEIKIKDDENWNYDGLASAESDER